MMSSSLRSVAAVLMLLVALAAAGCASHRTSVESNLGIRGAPDWVNQGSQALNDRDGRYIHGVGSAPTMADRSLQESTADNRARAEVARVLSSYMDVVMRDYTAQAGGSDGVNEQAVSRQIDNLTRVNMSGVRIIARWRDPRTDIVYSLAELDMERVQATVAATEEMNRSLREHIGQRGNNLFDNMAQGD
ncbi:hypothetical protein CAI21_07600 [Alkalilimnicola ehrlichii]|uniref:Lipoprotein n=1 Tax=Alkalilimnicola ehrlichii TaxID=351052 RepID=A0A3E0WZT2_9GAMM|nr:hypothetical protein [Alkalilimnicola ehrlichii]RFA30064.1 hypothetical protein CAI21_07600 [Alkalilimnicola ehrlichii]RFA37407.1 hypothetical protein CAL65_08940 [Alkalilimnicola ehrlichii]